MYVYVEVIKEFRKFHAPGKKMEISELLLNENKDHFKRITEDEFLGIENIKEKKIIKKIKK